MFRLCQHLFTHASETSGLHTVHLYLSLQKSVYGICLLAVASDMLVLSFLQCTSIGSCTGIFNTGQLFTGYMHSQST